MKNLIVCCQCAANNVHTIVRELEYTGHDRALHRRIVAKVCCLATLVRNHGIGIYATYYCRMRGQERIILIIPIGLFIEGAGAKLLSAGHGVPERQTDSAPWNGARHCGIRIRTTDGTFQPRNLPL